ncbi:MAG: Sensor histidine kinase TodS [Bacteroidetes bacterium ADurb.Bin123]|nr:MAG: Sensor histidine kinase TodS [Bacteroidetes bacterium ADurb.Bin123]
MNKTCHISGMSASHRLFKKLLVVWGLLAMTCAPGLAGNYTFKQYQVEDGLSNNNVTCCLQDTRGFIWIGTREGLNRFDGYAFRIFRDTDSGTRPIGNNWILGLAIDPNGTLWVGTFMGIYKYNEKEENFDPVPFCKGMKAKNLVFDSSGNLWVILDGKLVKYNVRLNDHQTYNIPDNGVLTSFCYTSTEKIWLVLSNGMLYQFDLNNGEFTGTALFSQTPDHKIRNLTTVYPSLSEDRLFIGSTTFGAKLFDIKTMTYKDIMAKESAQGEISVNGFLQTTPEEVWIVTESGLFIYDMVKERCTLYQNKIRDPFSLTTDHLYSITKDKENGIWIGTYAGGINYCSPYQPFTKYYASPGENGLRGDIIHDITTDQYGNVWIGTEDAGLNKYNPQTGKYTHFAINPGRNGISHKNLHGLVADGDRLWVGSIRGVDLMDIPSGRVVKHYRITDNRAIVIMKKMDNGKLLVGTANGMYVYNEVSDQFEPVPGFPSNVRIQSILEDHSGVIWAGTFNKGLFYYNPADKTHGKLQYDTLMTNNDNTINDIYEDGEHNLWLATQAGLKKYDRKSGSILRYTVKNGMPGNITFRILPDEFNNLWVSTTNGLVRLNPSTHEIKVYKKEHGIITNQFNYNSSWKDKEGVMYFGMVKGMVSFQPADIRDLQERAQVCFTTMTLFDQRVNAGNTTIPVAYSKQIRLKYSQSSFSVGFSSLSYIAPAIMEYAFCLEGLQNDWIYLGNTNGVTFTKLPPGDYTLKVKSRNSLGNWNEIPSEIALSVARPWWFSKIAWLVYFFVFAAVCALVIRSVILRNRRKVEEKITRIEYKKEKELHQAKINFFINIAHEIRTPLTLITGPLEKVMNKCTLSDDTQNYLSIMDKNAKRLLQLVDQLLDFRDTELQGYRLNFEKKNVASVLQETFNRFREAAEENNLSFELTSNAKQLYVSMDEDAFVKVISNLLLNAIKYAQSKILVRLGYQEGGNHLVIDVVNDGQRPLNGEKIFEPFFRGGNAEFKPGTGLGLPIARSLAEMHSGRLDLIGSDDGLITFRLQLPVDVSCQEESREVEKAAVKREALQQEFVFEPSRPTVLVVEDNEEMKDFIAREINATYNVVTARDGEEAMSLLKMHSIQLIVSDIMMPVMDGLDMLRKVKTDLEYSHIPVILLTARNTVQSRLEGLESGADAYIEKPFTVDILLAQISNLLNNRNTMRNHFFNSPIANLKSIAYTKADELFLEDLNEIITRNISNPHLDVEMIAGNMNVSRPTLYRKIKAISDLSPNELIRISRLKKAAELILQNKFSLSEISEKVGFSSQSYFSRSFSKQFEISPSEYARQKVFTLKT